MFGNRSGRVRASNTGVLGLVAVAFGMAACGRPPTASSDVGPAVQWSPAERVVTLTEENQRTVPQVALDGRGEAVVAWRQISRPGGEHVSVVRQEAAGWSPPANLGPVGVRPEIAVSHAGTALIVWGNPIQGRRCVVGAVGAGPAWSVGTVDCDRTDFPFPTLAMNDGGQAVVAWQAEVGPSRSLRATLWSEQGGWAAPVELDRDQSGARFGLAVAPDGRAFVVWAHGPPHLIATGLSIAMASSAGVWESPQAVPGAGRDVFPRLTTDAAGAPLVAWFGEDGIAYTRLGAGGWSSLVPVGRGEDFCLEVAGGRPGEALLGWRAGGVLQVSRIQEGRSPAVQMWPGSCPRLRMDDRGNAIAVWTTQDTEDAFVSWAAVGTPDGRWADPLRVGGPADRVGAISAALRDGRGILTWVEMTGTVVSIHVQRLRFPD